MQGRAEEAGRNCEVEDGESISSVESVAVVCSQSQASCVVSD